MKHEKVRKWQKSRLFFLSQKKYDGFRYVVNRIHFSFVRKSWSKRRGGCQSIDEWGMLIYSELKNGVSLNSFKYGFQCKRHKITKYHHQEYEEETQLLLTLKKMSLLHSN